MATMYAILLNLMDEYYSTNSKHANTKASYCDILEVLEMRKDELKLYNATISLVKFPSGIYDENGDWIIDPHLKNERKKALFEGLQTAMNDAKDSESVYIQIIGHGGGSLVQIEDFSAEELFTILFFFAKEKRLIVNLLGTCNGDTILQCFKKVCHEQKKSGKLLYKPGIATDDDTPFLYFLRGYADKPLSVFINDGPGLISYREWDSSDEFNDRVE